MEGDVRLLIVADMEIHLQLGVISAGQITWCVGRTLCCGHTHIRYKNKSLLSYSSQCKEGLPGWYYSLCPMRQGSEMFCPLLSPRLKLSISHWLMGDPSPEKSMPLDRDHCPNPWSDLFSLSFRSPNRPCLVPGGVWQAPFCRWNTPMSLTQRLPQSTLYPTHV
jgi:hypothetical protein